MDSNPGLHILIENYRIFANSFCRNYSFLNLDLFTVTFGDSSRAETIRGNTVFVSSFLTSYGYIAYLLTHKTQFSLVIKKCIVNLFP